ncbi:hypothetical protein [Nocardia sp. NPDC051463]|uniref:hypothetical protein n=1 Tax=Nocardia sp. NPDC051463 TaxID=3154845 RepID=UPI00344F4A18
MTFMKGKCHTGFGDLIARQTNREGLVMRMLHLMRHARWREQHRTGDCEIELETNRATV